MREFAQLIGKLVAAELGVLYAPLHYKPIEFERKKWVHFCSQQQNDAINPSLNEI